MHKYEIILYWSDEDACWVAEVPQLEVCAAHGNTAEEALANVAEATELWIESARIEGTPIPEPKGRKLDYA
jgi:predicted RNase H-like HicB family nuclease